jgi:DNA-binding NarL/FixJ family response regulator
VTVRVVLADDHPFVRAGVRASLEAADFEVVAEAGDATTAVDAVAQHRPDLALLDINMPGSGIRAARAIAEHHPDTAIVMLTVSHNEDDLFQALQAGASGYLLKDTDPERLPMALLGVLNGEAALPRALVARLIGEFQHRGRRRLSLSKRPVGAALTAKEWEVLELLHARKTTAEIATAMAVAPVTVRSHVAAILRKLQVPDRKSALALIDEDDPVEHGGSA